MKKIELSDDEREILFGVVSQSLDLLQEQKSRTKKAKYIETSYINSIDLSIQIFNSILKKLKWGVNYVL